MVVWSTIEASCPLCANRLRLRDVGSGFATGQDSDLFVRMRGKHVIQAEVHTCHHCRYSGYTRDFLRDLSDELKEQLIEETIPLLVDDDKKSGTRAGPSSDDARPARSVRRCRRTPLPHVQYHWAAKIAEAIDLSARDQGERLLRAYWCLRIPPSVKLPERTRKRLRKRYLTGAIRKFRQDLRYEKDPHMVFLVAELCRRNGNFLLATSYFRRFLERSEDEARAYIRQAAEKLYVVAKERVSAELTMETLLYDPAVGSDDE